MRNYILITIGIILNAIPAISNSIFDSLEFKRIYYDYNGSASNGNNIIVYGDAGIILKSTDGFNSFEKIILNPDYNIVSITNVNSKYYGLLNKDYLVISEDGETWKLTFLDNEEFYKIKGKNGYLYCLGKNKIIIADLEGTIINTYTYTNSSDIYDFEILNDKIYISVDKVKLLEINLNNGDITNIDLTEYGTIYNNYQPSNLIIYNNKLYFKLSNRLYYFDGDKAALSISTDLPGIIFNKKDELFSLSHLYIDIFGIDSIYCNKVDLKNGEIIKVNNTFNDRYLSNIDFDNVNVFSGDTIIVTGKNNFIYLSYDGGKNWKLISHLDLNKLFDFHILDENTIFALGKYVKFLHTTNGGLTWLPQKNYDKYFKSDIRFSDNRNNYIYYYDKFISYFFTDIDSDTNIIYSEDLGETVKLKNTNGLIGYPQNSNFDFGFLDYDNELYFRKNISYQFGDWTIIYKLDKNLEVIDRWSYDSIHTIKVGITKDNKIYSLVYDYHFNDENPGQPYINLLKSTNGFQELEPIWQYKKLNYGDRLWDFTTVFFDKYFFFAINTEEIYYIYCLDVDKLSLKQIYKLGAGMIPINHFIQKINDKYYLTYLDNNNKKFNIIEFSNIDNDTIGIKDVTSTNRYNISNIKTINDSLYYISGYDTLTNTVLRCIAKNIYLTSVEKKYQASTYLSLREPYPIPSKDKIMMKFYFNSYYNPQDFKYEVYDIYGNRVSQISEFTIHSLNHYSAILEWQIPNISPGVYFITIGINNEKRAQKIIISK